MPKYELDPIDSGTPFSETGDFPGAQMRFNPSWVQRLRFRTGSGGSGQEGLENPVAIRQATPLSHIPTEGEISRDWNNIAPDFYTARTRTRDALDDVGYPTLEQMLNGGINDKVVGDFCSGTGALVDKLLKWGRPNGIVAVDSSERMIRISKAVLEKDHPKDSGRLHHIVRSVTDMKKNEGNEDQEGLKDNSIEIGFCIYGLDYVNVPMALEEISRVLIPNARFIALVPHPYRDMGYWKAAGNDGAFKNGQWVREIWPGGGQKGVTKQYFHLEGPGGWLDMFKQSNFKIDHIISPEPRDEAKIYSPEIWELFRESGKRMMIFDAINNK